jgi:lipoprotein-anchoring transpeptidase ErfK/SrfK
MTVSVNGVRQYTWKVSTGRSGYGTPTGSYRPQRLERSWYSRKYDNAPMPHSVFFRGGYAIHGTNAVSRLGSRASHGCVRLAPGNAATLYSLISKYGMGNARVVITQ